MTDFPFTADDLAALRQWDTPTICNALELVVPHRRGYGFTIRPFLTVDPTLRPICGLARTGTIRASAPSGRTREVDRAARLGWYDYVEAAPMPTVVVLHDLDDTPGTGSFWGEVHTAVHKALGAQGVVTNGATRDIDMSAPGFQMLAGMVSPSHAYVHIVQYGQEVSVHGMAAHHEAVVHADRHGAVVIPHDAVTKLPAAIDQCIRREAVILEFCRSREFSAAGLKDVLARADEVH
ncbi:RraA family protein [Roseomonas elaeocarpi]|uniref:RraA family protein n=1 Tax=Roseomonas elaeocarpi TaxID=907779 RepID=A0ABV6JXC2_9PROT